MSDKLFQSRRPPVAFLRNGAARVVIRRETFEDLSTLDL